MSRDEIAAIVTAFSDLAQVVQQADPQDKADIYAQLRLTLTYQPEEKLVQATINRALTCAKGLCPRAVFAKKPIAGSSPEAY